MEPTQNSFGQPTQPPYDSGYPPVSASQQPGFPQPVGTGSQPGLPGVVVAPVQTSQPVSPQQVVASQPPLPQPYAGVPYQSQPVPPPRALIKNQVMYHMGPVSIKRRLAIIVGTLVAVSLLVGGLIIVSGLLRQPGKYRDLIAVSVEDTGSEVGGMYALEIPKEFVTDQKDADSVSYVHMASDKPNAEILGRISATAVFVGDQNVANLRTELTNQAIQQKGAVYDGFIVDHIRAVMSDLEGDVTVDTFTESTTPANNATLTAGFGLAKDDGTRSSGRIMVVFGKKHMYILSAVSDATRWESNRTVWGSVFESFVIDTTGSNE